MAETSKKCYAQLASGVIEVFHNEGGALPLLVPTPGILLTVNGQKCSGEVFATSQDKITITSVDYSTPGSWSLWVSPNNLAAYVRLQPGKVVKRSLTDLPPSERLVLTPTETVEYVPAVSLEELTSKLGQERMLPQADMSQLSVITQTNEPGQYLIASGVAPTAGQDAVVALFFEADQKLEKQYHEDKSMDFRARFEYTAVKEGQVLAKRKPPVPGTPGTGVRGEQIAPREPKDVKLVAGSGVVYVGASDELVATRSGRPVLRRTAQAVAVDVIPDMVVRGSVNLKTGHISFLGDVTVVEDVAAGFSVWAGGQVQVGGVVENADIKALTGMVVKGNVISSEIQVGPPLDFVWNIRKIVPRLSDELRRLTFAVEQLKQRMPADKKRFEEQLIVSLIKQRCDDFEESVKKLNEQLTALDRRLLEVYSSTLSGTIDMAGITKNLPLTLGQVNALAGVCTALTEKLAQLNPEQVELSAHNINSSRISCTGSLNVSGGIYNSRVQVGGKVNVRGVFRGGELTAGGDVAVKELGSESSVLTVVTVPTNARVAMNTAWENACVTIGPRRYRFEKKQVGVTMFIEEGNLMIR